MPKRRSKSVKEFEEGANKDNLDPKAKRDYKAINLNFNKFEWNELEKLCELTDRQKTNAIRWALKKTLKEVQN